MKSEFWHVWTIPFLLGALSLFGLIAALVGDTIWDVLSWIALIIPVVVVGRFVTKPTATKRQNNR